ncbi:5915_t:CDS:2 [Paraglomus occultum]|uniref:5915_t:CDS:1 n=1 Tax=Paraglomus occultum TaxID=144539 RepID=A0A9N9F1E8_9GLOM|nr:5915_t:CDS:2 [Paraglomus occultum]
MSEALKTFRTGPRGRRLYFLYDKELEDAGLDEAERKEKNRLVDKEDSLKGAVINEGKIVQTLVAKLLDMDMTESRRSSTDSVKSVQRKRRLEILQDYVSTHKKKLDGKLAFSEYDWTIVSDAFGVKSGFGAGIFDPPTVNVPSDTLDEVMCNLKLFRKAMGRPSTGVEAKKRYFIGAVIFSCAVFVSDEIAVDIESSLVGKEVPANGNVEFLVRIGNFVICIVEAKKSDFDQGRAQNYVACEVAYELNGGRQSIVYGIVSNFVDWIFVRLTDEAVKEAEDSVSFDKEGYPDRASVEKICNVVMGIFAEMKGLASSSQ